MLWCYAYNASDARDSRDAGFRRPNRMEVGRRQRCDALLGSCRSRRHAHGVERGGPCRDGDGVLYDTSLSEPVRCGAVWSTLPQLRNLEAGAGRDCPEYRRGGRGKYQGRSLATARSCSTSVPRWSACRRLRRLYAVHTDGSPSRHSHGDRGDQRSQRQSYSGNRFSELHRTTGFHCESASRTRVTQSTQAPTRWGRRVEQAAYESTFVRGVEWRAASHQSIDQSTGQTGSRARTEEALGSSAVTSAPLGFGAAPSLTAQFQRTDLGGASAGAP